MRSHPASELNPCPLLLTGSHQGQYICFNVSKDYELRHGKETGWGSLIASGSFGFTAVYEGGLHEKNAVGQGQLHIQSQKFSYFGGWLENVASGWGKWSDSWTVYWPEGPMAPMKGPAEPSTMKYEGGFKNGYFHGYGELTWNTGAYYKGSWKEGRRHGRGVYVSKDGNDRYYWEPEVRDQHDIDHDVHSDSHHHEHHHDVDHDVHDEIHHHEHHHDHPRCYDHCHDHEHCSCHCHQYEAIIPICILEAEERRTKDSEKKKADAEKKAEENAKKYDSEREKYVIEHQKYETEKHQHATEHQDLEQKLYEQKLKVIKAETESDYLKKEIEDMRRNNNCVVT